ncbi:hypothetical protein JCM5350_000002 [Sporobolomyces pararoseus]
MSSTLKQELKAWEAAFRSEYGRDPTKQDIKQNTEIALKYKEYNKSKQAAVSVPSNVFKTPTKSRNSRKQSTSSTTTRDTLSDNPFIASSDASTSNTTKASSNSELKSNGTQYVLANSPSKLRALAAMHSTTGSPNRPSGPNWLNATASTSSTSASTSSSNAPSSRQSKPSSSSSSTASVPPPTDFNRSPRKALNPFASPKKKEVVTIQPPSRGTTLFGDFEKLERERLKKKKSRVKVKSGMGWGHASDVLESLEERGGGESEKMEVDEVDDFFGGGNSAKKRYATTSTTNSTSSLAPSILSPSKLATTNQSNPFLPSQPSRESNNEGEEDDEMLGPSPVKPSSFQRTSSFGFDHSKPFKPLFDDTPAPSLSAQSGVPAAPQESSSKPKLFTTSLRTNSVPPEESSSNRGMKRTTSRTTIMGKGKAKDEMDALLEDGDDGFYADALDAVEKEIEGNAAGNKGKRKRITANGRGKGKGKGKGLGNGQGREDSEGDGKEQDDDELRVEKDDKGGLILDFRIDGHQGEAGETRERILVHRQGRGTRRRRDGRADQNGREDEDEMDEDEFFGDEVSLLDRPQPRSIVSSRPQLNHSSDQQPSSSHHASLPSELASILSLRASPQKSSTNAKELQIAKLLGEPTAFARQRRRGGLLELADELAEEDWDEDAGGENEGEGDDDWDDEVDGWKQTGEAMDGYYSGGEDW